MAGQVQPQRWKAWAEASPRSTQCSNSRNRGSSACLSTTVPDTVLPPQESWSPFSNSLTLNTPHNPGWKSVFRQGFDTTLSGAQVGLFVEQRWASVEFALAVIGYCCCPGLLLPLGVCWLVCSHCRGFYFQSHA